MPLHQLSKLPVTMMPPDVVTFIAQREGPGAAMELVKELIEFDKIRLGLVAPQRQLDVLQRLQTIVRKHLPQFDAFYGLQGMTLPLRLSKVYAPGTAPVYQLPVELLTRIFTLVVRSVEAWPFDHHFQGPRSSMIVRAVCRHWRAVAEAAPALWTNVPNIVGTSWATRALEWTAELPLDVTLLDPVEHDVQTKGKAAEMREANALILAELPRIRSLDALVPKIIDHPTWSLLTAKPALNLENLSLRGRDETHNLYPDALFGGIPPPRLHTFKSSYASLFPENPVFRSPLTHLHLESCYAFANVGEVLSVLSELPLLESFIMRADWDTLNDRFDSSPIPAVGQDLSASRSVQLPHLHELILREPLPIVLGLFEHLEVPLSTRLELRGFYGNIDPVDSVRVFEERLGPHLLSTYPDVHDGFTSLKLDELDGIAESGFDAIFDGASPSSPSGPSKFVFGAMGLFPQLFMCMLFWTPMSAHIRRLELSHDDLVEGVQSWEQLLGRLPNLEEVYFNTAQDVMGFGEFLDARPDALPCLRQVVFESVILSDAALGTLMDALTLRGAASYRVGVTMIHCDVSQFLVERLRAHERIGEVEWDEEWDGVTSRDVALRMSLGAYTAGGMLGVEESINRSRERVAEVATDDEAM